MARPREILKAFCAWGDGPDVGINVYIEPADSNELEYSAGYDLTIEEARRIAYELLGAADQAERLDRLCMEHDEVAGG